MLNMLFTPPPCFLGGARAAGAAGAASCSQGQPLTTFVGRPRRGAVKAAAVATTNASRMVRTCLRAMLFMAHDWGGQNVSRRAVRTKKLLHTAREATQARLQGTRASASSSDLNIMNFARAEGPWIGGAPLFGLEIGSEPGHQNLELDVSETQHANAVKLSDGQGKLDEGLHAVA